MYMVNSIIYSILKNYWNKKERLEWIIKSLRINIKKRRVIIIFGDYDK